MANGSIKSRYGRLQQDREPYLTRARAAAKLTIPTLIPEEGHNKSTPFETPWQSIGSKGTNNLASKMLLSLFPPNSPIFRMRVDEADLAGMDAGTRGDVDKALAGYERVVTSDMENSKSRSSLFLAFKHLIIAGNALLFEDSKSGSVRLYPISRYVVKRDADGNVYETIAVDYTSWGALSEEVRGAIIAGGQAGDKQQDSDVSIYTRVRREPNGSWTVLQEIEGVIVPNSEGTYTADANPWIPLRMIAVDGESYGRSFIEEIFGDLNTVDALTQAISEGSAAGAVVKFLVDPNGQTDVDEVVETANGGFCTGREQDISVLQVGKFADLRVAKEVLTELKADLSYAFLMHSAVQRNAERVTAEEIRFMAQELEDALGGLYSVLAQELQLPLVKARIKYLQSKGKLPKLPDIVKPSIITGLEALGRSHEQQRLRGFVAEAGQMFGPEAIVEYVEVSEYLKRSGAAWNVETNGLVRDEQTVQQNRQMRAQQEAEAIAQAQAAKQQPQQ